MANPPNYPGPRPGYVASANKTPTWIWIVAGFGFFLTVLCGTEGYYFLQNALQQGQHKVEGSKQVTIQGAITDTLLQANSYEAAVRAAKLNPDLVVESTDDETQTLTVRFKSTGDTTTMQYDPTTKKMVIVSKTSAVSVTQEGGTTTIQSSDRISQMGKGTKNVLPAWVPAYPGATTTMAGIEPGDFGHTRHSVSLEIKDPLKDVVTFYRTQLTAAGFKVTSTYMDKTSATLRMENAQHTFSLSGGQFPGTPATVTVDVDDKQ